MNFFILYLNNSEFEGLKGHIGVEALTVDFFCMLEGFLTYCLGGLWSVFYFLNIWGSGLDKDSILW